jgi:hypothetical protein
MNTHTFPWLGNPHTFQTKPSRIRRAEDEHIAATLAKARNFADYDPSINPWPEGDIRHDRVRRIYENRVRQYRAYDPIFRDICEAYGYDPDQHRNDELPQFNIRQTHPPNTPM